jgi:hypothetical protein
MNTVKPGKPNLDDLWRAHVEALGTGVGSGKWIKCAQFLMESFPTIYNTAKEMNEQREQAALRIAQTGQARTWLEMAAIQTNLPAAKQLIGEALAALDKAQASAAVLPAVIPVHDDDSHSRALTLVEQAIERNRDPAADSPEGIWLDAQSTLVSAYEKKRWPMEAPVPNVQATAPATIFLQIGEDVEPEENFSELHEVLWCTDQIHDNDILYVRADLADPPATSLQDPDARLRTLTDLMLCCRAHEDSVRVMGNVRAVDAAAALSWGLKRLVQRDLVAPIARLTVDAQGKCAGAALYAPGLPEGTHDVYPCPMPTATHKD